MRCYLFSSFIYIYNMIAASKTFHPIKLNVNKFIFILFYLCYQISFFYLYFSTLCNIIIYKFHLHIIHIRVDSVDNSFSPRGKGKNDGSFLWKCRGKRLHALCISGRALYNSCFFPSERAAGGGGGGVKKGQTIHGLSTGRAQELHKLIHNCG